MRMEKQTVTELKAIMLKNQDLEEKLEVEKDKRKKAEVILLGETTQGKIHDNR